MKTVFFIFFSLFLSIISFAQTNSGQYKVQQVLPEEHFYLNSSIRIGGKTRTYFKVDLPENTVEWYYSITTSLNEAGRGNLKLTSQLAGIMTGSSMSANFVSNLFSPTGSGVCDVYLLNSDNIRKFIDKSDVWSNGFKYYMAGSRENIKNSVVRVTEPIDHDLYIGVRNTSAMDGIYIQVEVTAIVSDQKIDKTAWTTDVKNQFFSLIKEAYIKDGHKADEASELSGCIVSKLTSDYTPQTFSGKAEFEKKQILEKYAQDCSSKISGTDAEPTKQAVLYGNLGWQAYEEGKLDRAIELSKKALTNTNTLSYVKYNLGLFYLAKRDESTAYDLYIDAIMTTKKGQLASKKKEEFSAAIKDLDEAISKGIVKSATEIKKLLESERDTL